MNSAAEVQIQKSREVLAKHLGGRHDEKSHGNRGKGGGDDDDWAVDHAQKIGSAYDAWMSPDKKKALRKIVDQGGKVKSRVFEVNSERASYSEALNRVKAQMARNGWSLFADEGNVDQGEAIFVQRKKK